MMDEEIRQAVSEVREMKQMCGNINMKLTNIVTQRGQDIKKKLEAEYQRGLDDAWEAVRKVIHLPEGVVLDLFTDCYSSVCTALQVFLKYEGSEVIEKLKSYEEKQKAEDEIKVGDEVDWLGTCFIVTRIFQPYNMKEQCDGIDDDGCVYNGVLMDDLEKTGNHYDIASILKEMQS